MDHYITLVTEFIKVHHVWAGPLLALATFGESLVLVGFFIPATALLLVVGTLVGSGVLPAGPLLLWLIAGAVVGDAVSYWFGRWAGRGLARRPPLNRYRRQVAQARLFFIRYGFISIFLGRFLGPIRSTIPLVAGMMRMRARSFQLANVSSAIIWVIVMLAPGYLVAKGAGSMGMMAGEQLITIVTMVIVLSVLGTVVGARFMQHVARKRVAAAASQGKPPEAGG